MIPDEAVEAAAKAEYEHEFLVLEGAWNDAPKDVRTLFRQSVRVALEAAAPHMTAPVLALADKWQADFPDKARQLREAIGDNS